MLRNNSVIKRLLGLFLCILVCLTTAFAVRYIYSYSKDYFVSNYDFSDYETEPKVGETIALYGLMDKNGKSFLETNHKEFILLGVVDSECGACKVAKDQVNWIQEGIKDSNVEYIFVSFTSKKPEEEFSVYADSFNISSSAFLWKYISTPSPNALLTMVVPSHFLINSNGKILRKFHGTDKNISVRKSMAKQIIKEINEEIKTSKVNKIKIIPH